MPRHSFVENHPPGSGAWEASTSFANHRVLLAIISLFQTGILPALGVGIAVLTREPVSKDEQSPVWSIPAGSLQVRSAEFAPDGRRLEMGGENGDVVLWEVGEGVEKVLCHDRQGRITCVAFSPDGFTLAAGGTDFRVMLWDVRTGKELTTFTGHEAGVQCLGFSPDGATVATGGGDSSIRLWDVNSGRTKKSLRGHPGAVVTVRFAPDGRTLASGCSAGVIKLWNASDGKCRTSHESTIHKYAVRSLAFSPDGSTLASGDVCGNIRLRDVATGLERVGPRTEVVNLQQIAFTADGQTLIAAKCNGELTISGLFAKFKRTIRLGNFYTYCSAFSPSGSLIAQTDSDGKVRVWDLTKVVGHPAG
jgi:WD40 repeat protein